MPDRLSVLIPAYNEAASIAAIVGMVRAFDASAWDLELEIIVCDDGSLDGTGEILETLAAADPTLKVVRHASNQGKGAAIRSALAIATGRYALIQDADLEYRVSDYIPILDALTAGAPVVYGSRFKTRAVPTGMKWQHLLANKLLTWTANLLFGMGITDEATCLKAFETALLKDLGLTCQAFEFCPEVTAKIGLRRIPVVEVPIDYEARTTAAGKKIRWQDGVQAFWVLVSHRLFGGGRPGPRPMAATSPSESTAVDGQPADV